MGGYKSIYWLSKEIICHVHGVVVPPCGTKPTAWSFTRLESAFPIFLFGWESLVPCLWVAAVIWLRLLRRGGGCPP